MLKPSAAPLSYQCSMVSATCSAVPAEGAVAASAAEPPDELPYGQMLAAGQLHDERVAALGALDLVLGRDVVGQFGVEVEVVRGDPQAQGELALGVLGDDEAVQFGVQLVRLGLGVADDGDDAGQDLDGVGVPAAGRGPRLDVPVEGGALLQGLLGGEHGLGVPGGEVLAVLAGPGLHEQWVTLRRALDVEGAVDAEELAPVVDGPDPFGERVDALLLVGDDCVVRPAVPQLGGHLDELGRAAVALVVQRGVVQAEVAGGVGPRGGDDVPVSPAAGDVVQEANLRARL